MAGEFFSLSPVGFGDAAGFTGIKSYFGSPVESRPKPCPESVSGSGEISGSGSGEISGSGSDSFTIAIASAGVGVSEGTERLPGSLNKDLLVKEIHLFLAAKSNSIRGFVRLSVGPYVMRFFCNSEFNSSKFS